MITFTTPIPVPNIPRGGVLDVKFDEDNNVASVSFAARSPAGPNKVYEVYTIAVVDGDGTPAHKSQRLNVNGTSVTYRDLLVLETQIEIPNGFTNLRNAWFGAGAGRAARQRAAETQGLADGWLAAALGGVVS